MNRKDGKLLDSLPILFEKGRRGKPGCDEGWILTQEPEKEITFAQGFSFPLKPWDFNYLTFIVIWKHFIQITLKKTKTKHQVSLVKS